MACCRAFTIDGEFQPKVDLKTVCSSGTAGVLSIAPSPNKTWDRHIADYAVPDIPDEMAETLASWYNHGSNSQDSQPRGRGRPKKAKLDSPLQASQRDDMMHILKRIGFDGIQERSSSDGRLIFDANCVDGQRTACPCCDNIHDHAASGGSLWW